MARRWQDVDWREHQHWARVQGRAVNYVEMGSGPPLLFVHGLSGCWQNWLENIEEFSTDHRVIAVDLPGFGHSEMPRGEDLDRGLRAVHRRVLRGGRDRRGDVRRQLDGRVRRGGDARSSSPTASSGSCSSRRRGSRSSTSATSRCSSSCTWASRSRSGSPRAWSGRSHEMAGRPRGRKAILWYVTPHAERWSPEMVIEQAAGAGKPGFLPALDALTDYPIRDRLDDIKCPTLIMWGEKDLLVPVKDAHKFHELIPDSRLISTTTPGTSR